MTSDDRTPELESLTNIDADKSRNGDVMGDDVIIEPFDTRRSLVPKLKLFLAANLMLILTCAGIVLGFAFGLGVRELHPTKDALMWIGSSLRLCLNHL